ncbi:adenosylmethionine-8-amino-7-oxononanoate aminotransferase [Streptomyces sp. 2132.2]|uniref:aspartate aminotransferase family protein n=1 Tax=Streptomyces sp. 2132.2 TaxID=2485161 RepID=UPI000F4861B1|nr:aspartate aminotransferase family protein [Streptomyces sp. 2132.2]ROQ96970.1 adenosylmethionine-8-amino-7-oxononanoate aminotransferase [Streptomyces sp. 2132.2]
MSSVLYKNIGKQPVWADSGHGVWLEDREGRRYLDTCGGVAVSSLGHRHPRIAEALERHSRDLSWVHAGSFTTSPAEGLAELLVGQSGGLSHAQFLSGGSEAMELAMKIAYQYHCERGESDRQVFIARRQSFHGSSLSTLAISGNSQRRSVFEPLLSPAEFVSPCYAYRDQAEGETEADYAQRLADELDARIRQTGPGRVAAFVMETVVGSTNGAVPPVTGYLAKIAEVCRRHGVLLILDEVMAGMGRTGHHYAYLEDGVVPDIVAVGKGLAAGYQPISAVLVSASVHDALGNGSGVLQNGQTHVNHPLACAIALEVQRTIVDEDLLPQVRARGEQLRKGLLERFADHPHVGDVRGRGLFTGVEFVQDRESRAPLLGGATLVGRMKKEGLDRGLLLYPGHGTVDGVAGNHVLFAPPFVVTESDIDAMVERFGEVVEACL